jgi:hypothetical protein
MIHVRRGADIRLGRPDGFRRRAPGRMRQERARARGKEVIEGFTACRRGRSREPFLVLLTLKSLLALIKRGRLALFGRARVSPDTKAER